MHIGEEGGEYTRQVLSPADSNGKRHIVRETHHPAPAKKSREVRITLGQDAIEELDALADRQGLTRAAYLRKLLASKEIRRIKV